MTHFEPGDIVRYREKEYLIQAINPTGDYITIKEYGDPCIIDRQDIEIYGELL